MVEKYRGLLPANSIWLKFNKEESLVLLDHLGKLEKMESEEILELGHAEIQAHPCNIDVVEKMIQKAGLTIVPLEKFDK